AQHRGRLIVQTEPGYGAALLAGFAATTASFIITMDADLSHPPSLIRNLWDRREEADVLIASRYAAGGAAAMLRFRRFLSRVLNQVYARALALPIRDLSSSYRLYRRRALAGLTLQP